VDSVNDSVGERTIDRVNSNLGIGALKRGGGGGGGQNAGTVQQSDNGNIVSVVSMDKNGGSQLNIHSRRDAGYMNDMMRSRAIFKCVPVHYREKTGSIVALASFPGSGNTWLRYLLQLSTGSFKLCSLNELSNTSILFIKSKRESSNLNGKAIKM